MIAKKTRWGREEKKKLKETGGSDYPILNWEETIPSY